VVKLLRKRVAWEHPEWWALALSAAAWVTIALSTLSESGAGHQHGSDANLSDSLWLVARGVLDWMLMVVAMMFPLTLNAIQVTAARSLWRRRHRAVASWLAGYCAPWLLLGVLAALPVVAAFATPASATAVAPAFVIAATWQTSGIRARALTACHRTWPLAPTGWRATRDCVSSGWATSASCITACGPLMAACWLLGHGPLGVVAMMSATTITLVERYSVRPNPRVFSGVVALLALVALTFA
jgi:hypothetical protein